MKQSQNDTQETGLLARVLGLDDLTSAVSTSGVLSYEDSRVALTLTPLHVWAMLDQKLSSSRAKQVQDAVKENLTLFRTFKAMLSSGHSLAFSEVAAAASSSQSLRRQIGEITLRLVEVEGLPYLVLELPETGVVPTAMLLGNDDLREALRVQLFEPIDGQIQQPLRNQDVQLKALLTNPNTSIELFEDV